MKYLAPLNEVSRFYFFVLAGLYAVAALSLRNDFFTPQMLVAVRIFDLPLLLMALVYGGTTLGLQLYNVQENRFSPWVMALFAGGLFVFIGAFFLTFLFPDAWN